VKEEQEVGMNTKRRNARCTALSLALILLFTAAGSAEDTYQPSGEAVEGNELAFVYIGATACGPCKLPAVKDAVRRAKVHFARLAAEQKRPFSATGVAIDTSIDEGLLFLKDVGPFDQVVVGHSWFNLAVADLVGSDPDGVLGIPQIIIFERDQKFVAHRLVTSAPRVLARVPGNAIPTWVDAGAPLK
jgi:hypothetical protein